MPEPELPRVSIPVSVPRDAYEEMRTAAERLTLSISAYIRMAAVERARVDNARAPLGVGSEAA